VAGPIGEVADDFVYLDDQLSLTFGNLKQGNYQLVLYSHDRDANELTYDILLNGANLGRLNPVSGADPTIGISSARIAFGTNGTGDVTFTLDGIGSGASVVLNGLELYSVGDYTTALPPFDLNADGDLDLIDYQIFLAGLHADLSGLTSEEAYQMGDLNGDFQNNFVDFQLFKQGYDEWNGQGAFALAMAGVPEPPTLALFVVGLTCGSWLRAMPAQGSRFPTAYSPVRSNHNSVVR